MVNIIVVCDACSLVKIYRRFVGGTFHQKICNFYQNTRRCISESGNVILTFTALIISNHVSYFGILEYDKPQSSRCLQMLQKESKYCVGTEGRKVDLSFSHEKLAPVYLYRKPRRPQYNNSWK
jgi:hypothetical protein